MMLNLTYKIALNPIILLAVMGISSGSASAQIYVYVDDDGYTHFTNRPNDSRARPWQGKNRITAKDIKQRRDRYSALIDSVAQRYNLDAALLHAVIRAESAYDVHAVSRAGAVGLMQLMPATAQRYGVADRWDAHSNVHGGARYLRDLIAQFNNNLQLALAAYNAGENAVIRYGHKIPPFPETQQYVKKVLKFYQKARG